MSNGCLIKCYGACKQSLPASLFYNNHTKGSGLDNYCKSCRRLTNKQNYNNRKNRNACSSLYSDMTDDSVGDAPDHLYIMRYQFDHCGVLGVNVGRTENIAERVLHKEKGHNFRMQVLRVYKQQGNLEKSVHRLLAPRQMHEGAGTEWFDVGFATAMKAISLARSLQDEPRSKQRAAAEEFAAAFSESQTSASE